MTRMEEMKSIIAKNIAELRQSKGWTQIELAGKLNYTDKAISKWERAESIPDVTVLVQIADLFGVPLDHLVRAEHPAAPEKKRRLSILAHRNRSFITGMSILLVWMIALLTFVIFALCTEINRFHWLTFAYAVPASMIVWLVLNSIWFETKRNYLIISLLMWSILGVLGLTLAPFVEKTWLLLVLGLPGQVIILLWSRLRFKTGEEEPQN